MVSELSESRFELRKLEFFWDGTVDVAENGREAGRTQLASVAVPSLDEINQDPQFEGVVISKDEFEDLWVRHSPSLPH